MIFLYIYKTSLGELNVHKVAFSEDDKWYFVNFSKLYKA